MSAPPNRGKLPAYLQGMPGHTRISSNEIKEIFGFSNRQVVTAAVNRGEFPKPDTQTFSNTSLTKSGKCKKYYWKLSVVIKEIQRREAQYEH